MEAGFKPQKMRMLTFQRSERAEARRRWPDAHTQSDEEYYAAAESNWREIREGGVPARGSRCLSKWQRLDYV
jgi:hypothetical protein